MQRARWPSKAPSDHDDHAELDVAAASSEPLLQRPCHVGRTRIVGLEPSPLGGALFAQLAARQALVIDPMHPGVGALEP